MSKKQYWKGLEELHASPAFTEQVSREFREELPFGDTETLTGAPTSRRDFLKYLGFSTVAASLAASCEMPVRKAIPYAIKPENVTPGVPLMYASTYVDGGDAVPVLVRTREGRPIKLEGNRDSLLTEGATSARVQASVLNLYDIARLKYPTISQKESTWEAVDQAVAAAMSSMGQAPVYLISSSMHSPSSLEAIKQFTAKYPNTRHVMYDALSCSAILDANQASFGVRAIPAYRFDTARVIVSIGADFLGTWISPEIYAKQYSKGRKISAKNPVMSKHYQIEGVMSLTGGSADERYTAKPSSYGTVAVGILNALNGQSVPSGLSPALQAAITSISNSLKANMGQSLVVCGSNDFNVQTVVNAINAQIGAPGNTLSFGTVNQTRKGNDLEFNAFAQALQSGQVGGVMFVDCNPAYDSVHAKVIREKIGSLSLSVSFNDRMDETSKLCKIMAPSHHWLESWGDAEPFSGYVSLMQPTISPLFKTRPWEESLLRWSGNAISHYDYVSTYWKTRLGGQTAYDAAIQKGLVETEVMNMTGAAFSGNITEAITQVSASQGGKMEVVIYEKVGIGRGGAWSNNPWLQEMPDPVSKCTWDNYILISPNTAKAMGAEHTDLNEVERNKKVFSLKANGTEISLPVLVMPGMHDEVVAVAVGYGRSKEVGRAAADTGKNAYTLLARNGGGYTSFMASAELKATNEVYPLAITQTHHTYEAKRPIIHEFTLEQFRKNPNELYEERKHHLEHFTHSYDDAHGAHGDAHAGSEHGKEGHPTPAKTHSGEDWQEAYRKNGTLYPDHEPLGLKWGMSIDLSSCIGCGACTIACQAENNVSVVGKQQVMLVHDMHWLRIDRYFAGDPSQPDSIQTLFQPMLCQHCDNAPCENVCPVNATNHSNEGINQMAYNRCIGTRYCANNCPYKVRRFNWRDWNEADCFDDNAFTDGRRDDINNDITRMVLNPDVTVRSRGVMEKCSFCVQRLQGAKATAKKQGRVLKDGEAVTACQQSCPTNAIVFGNVNDHESEIYQLRYEEQKERVFHVLEELHVLPNINYLSKIRNAEHLQSAHHEEGGHDKPHAAHS